MSTNSKKKEMARKGQSYFDRSRQAMLSSHEKEATHRKAKFHNIGWGSTDSSISSKTSKGILTTNRRGKSYEHYWEK